MFKLREIYGGRADEESHLRVVVVSLEEEEEEEVVLVSMVVIAVYN
jgi:hypothetical protein